MSSKIVSLSYEYPPLGGGGAKVVNSLTDQLLSRGTSVDLVTMGFQDLPSRESIGRLRIYRIPCLRRRKSVCQAYEMIPYILLAIPLLLRNARNNDYSLNHTHFIFPDGVLASILKKLTGLPYIITAHGSDVPGYNPDRFQFLHKLLAPLWNMVTSNAETIVCPSAHLEGLIHKVNPRVKTTVIPNGIDIIRFNPNRPRKKQVLVVTRMVERKGVQYLLEALAGWDRDFMVNIVGDGPYLPTLQRRAIELGVEVNFLGYVDNKSEEFTNLFETSEIYIFTSSSENFPIVLLEAMTAGAAIITSNDTGCAEAVGECAVLVPPRNAAAIRDALQALSQNPDKCRELGRMGRQRVEKMFSTEAVTRQYIELYNSYGK